jgi:hypothetical protein
VMGEGLPPPPPPPGPNSPAAATRRWASRWSCTRATPTAPRCT